MPPRPEKEKLEIELAPLAPEPEPAPAPELEADPQALELQPAFRKTQESRSLELLSKGAIVAGFGAAACVFVTGFVGLVRSARAAPHLAKAPSVDQALLDSIARLRARNFERPLVDQDGSPVLDAAAQPDPTRVDFPAALRSANRKAALEHFGDGFRTTDAVRQVAGQVRAENALAPIPSVASNPNRVSTYAPDRETMVRVAANGVLATAGGAEAVRGNAPAAQPTGDPAFQPQAKPGPGTSTLSPPSTLATSSIAKKNLLSFLPSKYPWQMSSVNPGEATICKTAWGDVECMPPPVGEVTDLDRALQYGSIEYDGQPLSVPFPPDVPMGSFKWFYAPNTRLCVAVAPHVYVEYYANAEGGSSIPYDKKTRTYVMCTPLVLDLAGQGIGTARALVDYDLLADGTTQTMHDLAPGTALLVFDAEGDGKAGGDGRGLFGNRTDVGRTGAPGNFADGFDALDAFVRDAERRGILKPGTRERGRLDEEALRRLEKAYGLGVRVGGMKAEKISLAKAGVRELTLPPGPSLMTYDFDGRGDALLRREGALFMRADGSSGAYADIVLRTGRTPILAAAP